MTISNGDPSSKGAGSSDIKTAVSDDTGSYNNEWSIDATDSSTSSEVDSGDKDKTRAEEAVQQAEVTIADTKQTIQDTLGVSGDNLADELNDYIAQDTEHTIEEAKADGVIDDEEKKEIEQKVTTAAVRTSQELEERGEAAIDYADQSVDSPVEQLYRKGFGDTIRQVRDIMTDDSKSVIERIKTTRKELIMGRMANKAVSAAFNQGIKLETPTEQISYSEAVTAFSKGSVTTEQAKAIQLLASTEEGKQYLQHELSEQRVDIARSGNSFMQQMRDKLVTSARKGEKDKKKVTGELTSILDAYRSFGFEPFSDAVSMNNLLQSKDRNDSYVYQEALQEAGIITPEIVDRMYQFKKDRLVDRYVKNERELYVYQDGTLHDNSSGMMDRSLFISDSMVISPSLQFSPNNKAAAYWSEQTTLAGGKDIMTDVLRYAYKSGASDKVDDSGMPTEALFDNIGHNHDFTKNLINSLYNPGNRSYGYAIQYLVNNADMLPDDTNPTLKDLITYWNMTASTEMDSDDRANRAMSLGNFMYAATPFKADADGTDISKDKDIAQSNEFDVMIRNGEVDLAMAMLNNHQAELGDTTLYGCKKYAALVQQHPTLTPYMGGYIVRWYRDSVATYGRIGEPSMNEIVSNTVSNFVKNYDSKDPETIASFLSTDIDNESFKELKLNSQVFNVNIAARLAQLPENSTHASVINRLRESIMREDDKSITHDNDIINKFLSLGIADASQDQDSDSTHDIAQCATVLDMLSRRGSDVSSNERNSAMANLVFGLATELHGEMSLDTFINDSTTVFNNEKLREVIGDGSVSVDQMNKILTIVQTNRSDELDQATIDSSADIARALSSCANSELWSGVDWLVKPVNSVDETNALIKSIKLWDLALNKMKNTSDNDYSRIVPYLGKLSEVMGADSDIEQHCAAIETLQAILGSNNIELRAKPEVFIDAMAKSGQSITQCPDIARRIDSIFSNPATPDYVKRLEVFTSMHPTRGNDPIFNGHKISPAIQSAKEDTDGYIDERREIIEYDLAKCSLFSNNRSLRTTLMRDKQSGKLSTNIPRSIRRTGIDSYYTVDEALSAMDAAVARADKRGREFADQGKLILNKGDFVKGINSTYLENILSVGSVSQEYLGVSADSDSTPLDTDLSMVQTDSNSSNGTALEGLAAKRDGYAQGPLGKIYIALKQDNRFDITRRGDTENDPIDIPNQSSSKLEAFYTGVVGPDHYGIRTGFPSTDIDYLICDGEVSPAVKYEIVRNGFYIPVVNMDGDIVFSPDEYDELAEKTSGLDYLGQGDSYDMAITPDLELSGDSRIAELANHVEQNEHETSQKRSVIENTIAAILHQQDIQMQSHRDLTSGNGAQLVDTGSTGRGTNMMNDGDFDFMLNLDLPLYDNPESLHRIQRAIAESFRDVQDKQSTGTGDIRYKGVTLRYTEDDNGNPIPILPSTPADKIIPQAVHEVTVDIDITFAQKLSGMDYSTDDCLRDRLTTIRRLNPTKYPYVIANIQRAKEVLKKGSVYKPHHSGVGQDGLGGVGVENWILQHGGSFKSAAEDFLTVADSCNNFDQFKQKYQVWDFGSNYLAEREGRYPHDEFVSHNMTAEGYERMKLALRGYLESIE